MRNNKIFQIDSSLKPDVVVNGGDMLPFKGNLSNNVATIIIINLILFNRNNQIFHKKLKHKIFYFLQSLKNYPQNQGII